MRFFKKKEARTISQDENIDPVLRALLEDEKQLSAEEALQIPMVAACVEWISATVARLPIRLYERTEGSVIEVKSDPRVRMLNRETGDLLDAFQMKKAWCRDYLLMGAGYIYVDKYRNQARGLHYVDRNSLSPLKNTDPIFKSADIQVDGRIYRDFDFIRITRNSKDGVNGSGILAENQLILSVAYETLKFQQKIVKAGGCRKGFLVAEKTVAESVMADLKQAWKKLFNTGEENVIVLNSGLKFQEATNTSVEMQLNENKRADAESICNLFGVSTSLFVGTASDEEYNNSVKTGVLPILDAIATALDKALLLESEKENCYFEVDTRNLLKGDIVKRFTAYKLAAESNIMQLDEIRREENLPALGMEFIKLGLQDVLYNPKTGQIFTPNTGITTQMENGIVAEEGGENLENRDPQ